MKLRPFNNYNLYDFPPVLAWNPIAMRCTRVDEGCRNCWHLRMAERFSTNPIFDVYIRNAYGGTPFQEPQYFPIKNIGKSGNCIFDNNKCIRADVAMYKCVTSVICVQFMGDLFHPSVPRGWIDRIFCTMIQNNKHVFLLLTKRPENIPPWKIPDNCWLGTSVHDQASADVRIPQLLKTKCKNKWLSVEPMLGEVRLIGLGADEFGFIACGPETGHSARPCDGA